MNLPDRVLTVPEAARLFRVGERTYYQAAARGEVPAVRIGRRLVVPGAALARFLKGGDVMTNAGPDEKSGHSDAGARVRPLKTLS